MGHIIGWMSEVICACEGNYATTNENRKDRVG